MPATTPCQARGQVHYELDVADRHVTVLECRPPWRPEYGPEWTRFPIVRFHYSATRREWAIYWRDRNLKFHRYDPVDGAPHIIELIRVVDDDHAGILLGLTAAGRAYRASRPPCWGSRGGGAH